ncbi:MAG: hypothetical protein H6581_31135 [Bacteroidia bacterium]|nr:hypothetical protein [Bacteroidia bacterium]
MVEKIFTNYLEEVDTFESQFKVISFSEKLVIVFIICAGVSTHPINPSEKLKFIDKSFLVFERITFLKLNAEKIIINKFKGSDSNSFFLGGENLFVKDGIKELQIQSESSFLQVIPDYKLHSVPIRINDLLFEDILSENQLTNFIEKILPLNIQKLRID